MYRASLLNPEDFWREHGKRIDWIKPYTKVKDCSFDQDNFKIRWFEDGTLNASSNCLDRHLETHGDKTAFIFERDEPGYSTHITYKQLHSQVCRFANSLKSLGAKKGDRVVLYMPLIPEAVVGMLACARLGLIHSVVFGGFSPEALASRLEDCEARFLITADEGLRGGRKIALKENADKALSLMTSSCLEKVIVVANTGIGVSWNQGRDVYYEEIIANMSDICDPVEMAAEDPLFILYTSGSTGKPKGVLHTTGGYLVYASMTHEYVFDVQEDDVYWCTADVGWITGHSYVVYGPLANGATSVIYEGVPNYPDYGRFWDIIDTHQVNLFYTAPTAIRSLMKHGDAFVTKYNRSSLRILGSVGEPINVEAWQWYYDVVGNKNCPIMDTWWQTETGGILITPLATGEPQKPGCATQPFFGIQVALYKPDGTRVEGEGTGALVIEESWPGQMRGIFGDSKRFIEAYFSAYPGVYFSGDGARRDEDGEVWITGRMDDVLNVSGHRIGTAEVESALDSHPKVVESAVVDFPHPVKGQGVYAYVTLKEGESSDNVSEEDLRAIVKQQIGSFAKPEIIHWAPNLPKTRSGKIMRRILRKIAAFKESEIGDTSTLSNPESVIELIHSRPHQKI
tara:strand:- start:668 stop:2542 length:1875 start_codon:yes stop_codon:yes gene_type:complete